MVFVVSFIFLWLFQSLFLSSVTSPSVPVCLLFILLSLASCFILNIISSCGFPSILCFCFFTTPSCRVHFLFLCSPSACQITAVTPKSQFDSPVWLLCTWIWTFGFMFRTSSLRAAVYITCLPLLPFYLLWCLQLGPHLITPSKQCI